MCIRDRCCSHWYGNEEKPGQLSPLTENDKTFIKKNVDVLSTGGLRVLGFATKQSNLEDITEDDRKRLTTDRSTAESDLIFLGLIGIYDPPREETAGAVKKFHNAGINVRMLTGDFPGTCLLYTSAPLIQPLRECLPFLRTLRMIH